MPVRVEVLRSLNQWVKVDFGPMPFVVKSNISNKETKYILAEDDDGIDPLLYKFSPADTDLPKSVASRFGVLYDISVDAIEKDHPIMIEGIIPGSTKSEILRITQD